MTMTTTTKAGANAFLPPIIVVLAIALAGAFLLRAIDAQICNDGQAGSWLLNGITMGAMDTTPIPTCWLPNSPKVGDLVSVPLPRPDPRKMGGQ